MKVSLGLLLWNKAIDFLKKKTLKVTMTLSFYSIRGNLLMNFLCGLCIAIKIWVAVPNKNIRLAVQRNLIKRRIREAYRLNNQALKKSLEKSEIELNLMIIYTAREIFTYKEIEEKIKVILNRLNALCEKGFK